MKRIVALTVFLTLTVPGAVLGQQASARPPKGSCEETLFELRLPQSVGKRKGPVRMKWEDVDKVLSSLTAKLQGRDCTFTFGQLFEVKTKKGEEVLFPISNLVVKTVPEASLQGLQVFDFEGKPLGLYDSRVPHERSGGGYALRAYTLFSFQYKNPDGEYESVGGRLIHDDFFVKWSDLRDKAAVSTK
jgi:hypothetical protein